MLKIQGEFSWKEKRGVPVVKNKFIIFIILIIILIIWIWIFKWYIENNINRDSHVVLIKGKAMLNTSLLKIDKKEKLIIWDTVRTIWENALAVLEWWDGSVTRLWWNSSVKIDELDISDDLWKLNISFELLNWKSWSNVVSFLWEGSYFKEYFRDSEAAVRWTIFNVDLNSNYLYVLDHKVNLTTGDGTNILVDEMNPLNLLDFNFITLDEFIQSFKDKWWESLNHKIDIEFFDWLRFQIHSDLDELLYINDIDYKEILSNSESREELYNKLLTDYQKYNFIKPNESNLFQTKLELKEALVKLANPVDKNILVENTLYDFRDIISSKDYTSADKVLQILSDNKDLLKNINFNDYFDINILPEEIKNILINRFGDFKNLLLENFNNVQDKKVDIKNIEEKANQVIHDGLDTLFNK